MIIRSSNNIKMDFSVHTIKELPEKPYPPILLCKFAHEDIIHIFGSKTYDIRWDLKKIGSKWDRDYRCWKINVKSYQKLKELLENLFQDKKLTPMLIQELQRLKIYNGESSGIFMSENTDEIILALKDRTKNLKKINGYFSEILKVWKFPLFRYHWVESWWNQYKKKKDLA